MTIHKRFDSVKFPRCLLNYGGIVSGSRGREGENLHIIFYGSQNYGSSTKCQISKNFTLQIEALFFLLLWNRVNKKPVNLALARTLF